jgi:hypothetical protein
MKYLNEYNFKIDRHTVRATDDIIAQLLKVADDDGEIMIESAERVRATNASKFKNQSIYALVKIGPAMNRITGEGVIIERSHEVIVSVVFRLGTKNEDNQDIDFQAYGDGLADHVWSYLMIQLADNPNGMTKTYPAIWQYDPNAKFKDKLDRNVVTLDPVETKLSGSLYVVPLQFGITVFPTVPLT